MQSSQREKERKRERGRERERDIESRGAEVWKRGGARKEETWQLEEVDDIGKGRLLPIQEGTQPSAD